MNNTVFDWPALLAGNTLSLMPDKGSFDGKSRQLKQKLFKFLQLYFYAMESLMPNWLRMLICIRPKQANTPTHKHYSQSVNFHYESVWVRVGVCVCVCEGKEIPFVQTTTIKTSWGLRMSQLFCSLIHKFLIKLPSHFFFLFPFFVVWPKQRSFLLMKPTLMSDRVCERVSKGV